MLSSARLLIPVSVIAAGFGLVPATARAQQCAVTDYPSDTFRGGFTQGWGKHFGQAVDIDGTVAVVGGAGHVMVYELRDNRWLFVQNLLPPDNLVSSFGYSVAVSGTTIAVGDPGLDSGAGAVWVYERSGGVWMRGPRLEPSTTSYPPRRGARFGFSLDLAGNRLLVGAPGYDDQQTTVGYAFLYERGGSGWSEKAWLIPSGSHRSRTRITGFGHSVGIDGDLAAVGMPFDVGPGASLEDPEQPDVGRVSIHEAVQGWTGTTTIRPSRADADDRFGYAVAVSGVDIAVGAPFTSFTVGFGPFGPGRQPLETGAVYVYERTGPGAVKLASTLRPDEFCSGGYTSRYGWDVDLDGDRLTVGAPTAGLDQEGEAYLYERRGGPWVEQRLLTKDPRFQGRTDWFGTAVAVTAGWVISGAPRADRYVGEALMFEQP